MGTCRCYAFRGTRGSECLADHLREVVECSRGRWETEGMARKLSALYGVDGELVKDLVSLAALLHDIGKADSRYQPSCERMCEEFPNHYLLSAQFVTYLARAVGLRELSAERIDETLDAVLLKEVKELTEGYLYALAIVIPVLSHHYAQVNLARLTSREQHRELRLYKGCVEDLRELFEEVVDSMRTELSRRAVVKVCETLFKGIHVVEDLPVIPVKREHLFNLRKPPPQRFIADAVLGVLNLCDGAVASKNRSVPS